MAVILFLFIFLSFHNQFLVILHCWCLSPFSEAAICDFCSCISDSISHVCPFSIWHSNLKIQRQSIWKIPSRQKDQPNSSAIHNWIPICYSNSYSSICTFHNHPKERCSNLGPFSNSRLPINSGLSPKLVAHRFFRVAGLQLAFKTWWFSKLINKIKIIKIIKT